MINRQKFFSAITAHPFGGAITQPQVDGCNVLLDEAERRQITDLRWIAYILATAKWETAHTMQPIREFGLGHGHPYGTPINGHAYYGRGYVQLTWLNNYKNMAILLGADLVNNPDLALQPDIAAKIIFEGMIRGSFTGRKLADFFNASVTQYGPARQIVNGLDQSANIASIAEAFHSALYVASVDVATPEQSPPILHRGMSGDDVLTLQKALNAHPSPLPEDGAFGPETELELRRFQRRNGLPETGATDATTWAKLAVATESRE